MTRVFIPNQPTTLDKNTGMIVKSVDLTPAEAFGPLVFLLPTGELQGEPDEIVRTLQSGLADFSRDDYLLLAGDPRAIAWAAAIAADLVDGDLKLLHWARSLRRYRVVAVPLWPDEAAA